MVFYYFPKESQHSQFVPGIRPQSLELWGFHTLFHFQTPTVKSFIQNSPPLCLQSAGLWSSPLSFRHRSLWVNRPTQEQRKLRLLLIQISVTFHAKLCKNIQRSPRTFKKKANAKTKNKRRKILRNKMHTSKGKQKFEGKKRP